VGEGWGILSHRFDRKGVSNEPTWQAQQDTVDQTDEAARLPMAQGLPVAALPMGDWKYLR
jgi:hypothetical protein